MESWETLSDLEDFQQLDEDGHFPASCPVL